MIQQIFKYPLVCCTGSQQVALPKGAVILSVGAINRGLALWAQVDATEPDRAHLVTLYWTGTEIVGDPGKFIGTVIEPNGLVWHIFVKEGY